MRTTAVGSTGGRAAAATWLLLLATLLLGFAQIAVMPPWEGFDETAHWSYVQELADTGRAPVYGRDRFAADLRAYAGPMAYDVPGAERTYREFREAGAPAIPGHPTRYSGAGPLNWQAQHPPLFYALMTPVYRATRGWGWIAHLDALRSTAWLLAWLGWAVAVLATLRASQAPQAPPAPDAETADRQPFGPWTAPLMALWPFLFGDFFADLARFGNDGLCLFLVGLIWAILLVLVLVPARRARPMLAVTLGLILGAGLWTKAFFVPITGGVAALMVARAGRDRSLGEALDAALAGGLAVAIGAAWYLAKLHQTGALSGSDETVRLIRAGGMLHGLALHLNGVEVARGLMGVAQSVPWAANWSLVRMPSLLIYAALAVAVVPTVQYLKRLPRLPLIGWAPIAFAGPMLAGLVHHILIRIALDGSGLGTPGWYLHVVAPALALILALGWSLPRLSAALAAYNIAYLAAAQVMQLSLFSGCAGFDDSRHFSLQGAGCFIDVRTLERLGHPWLGAILLAAGAACGLAALVAARPWRDVAATGAEPELQPLEAA